MSRYLSRVSLSPLMHNHVMFTGDIWFCSVATGNSYSFLAICCIYILYKIIDT